MISLVKRLTGRLVLIGLAMLVWQQTEFREVAAQQLRRAFVWIAPGTEGRLLQYQQELERTLEELLAAEIRLQNQSKEQFEADLQRRDELARLDHLLACFRSASISGTKQGFPQQVFARSYTQAQIMELVQEMLDRRSQLERYDADANARLQQALTAIGRRISDTRCHLQNMPIYLSLGAAGDATDRFTQIQQALASCLQGSRESLTARMEVPVSAAADCVETQNAVLSTAPAVQAAVIPPSAGDVEVPLGGIQASDFLAPTAAELAEADATMESTVSELQQALRELVRQHRSETGGITP